MKRLEVILLKDAENKIASLSDEEAGEEERLTIEKIINQYADAR